ncbi:MAG: alpha/beta hydrolase [Bacteroidales bacterium]|nr:alpha/beta hydrolase [Bacteroidales bacterium]
MTIQVNDYTIYYEQICQADSAVRPVLVFLHDSWGCAEMWGDFPDKISRLFHLNAFVFDRRGYGKSSPFAIKRDEFYLHHEADELIKILDICKIQDVIIYGHSDGATIALIAAALYPQRVKGLVLEGAHSFIENSGKAAVRATRERAKTTGLLASLEKYHGNKTEELFRLWHETWLSDYFAHWTIVPLLKQITCPVLAFQGEYDEFGTAGQLNVLKKEITTHVTVAEIPDASHTPRKEAEKTTMYLISRWFESTFHF